MVTVHQAKGAGYAMSRTEELEYMQKVAQDTGEGPCGGHAHFAMLWAMSNHRLGRSMSGIRHAHICLSQMILCHQTWAKEEVHGMYHRSLS